MTGLDTNGNRTFSVQMKGILFPAYADDVLLRGLEEGDLVQFKTERETENALILYPPKDRGCIGPEAVG